MSLGGKCRSVQAGASCWSGSIQGQTLKQGWCLHSGRLPSLLAGVWEGNICWSVSNSSPLYYGYALGLRNDNCRTCDDLKNHAPMLSALQPAWDEWCIINPDPLPVQRLKKKERSFLIPASSSLKPPSCLGSYINQNTGLTVFCK